MRLTCQQKQTEDTDPQVGRSLQGKTPNTSDIKLGYSITPGHIIKNSEMSYINVDFIHKRCKTQDTLQRVGWGALQQDLCRVRGRPAGEAFRGRLLPTQFRLCPNSPGCPFTVLPWWSLPTPQSSAPLLEKL